MKCAHILGMILVAAGMGRERVASAQISVGANAGVFSSYVWRGVTYTNNLVIQPEIAVTVPMGRVSLTTEVWSNIEPSRYNGFSDISESGGTSALDVTEIEWTGELSVAASKRLNLVFGAANYFYPNSGGLTPQANSTELYGRAEFSHVLNPVASLYYDIRKVRGAYLEGEISRVIATGEQASLTLGALAGFSAGQGADMDNSGEPHAESYNFLGDGFTHADLWATADFAVGGLSLSPTLHFILTGDGATKVSKIEPEPGTGFPQFNRTGMKIWFGVSLGWVH